MDERRPTIKQQIYAFALCAFVFMTVYNFAAWYISKLEKVPSFVFGFERYIPFLLWSIIPYMTSGLFFCAVFFLCRDKEQLKILTKRMLFVTIVAGLFFILFPLQFSLQKPITEGSVLDYSFQFLKIFDAVASSVGSFNSYDLSASFHRYTVGNCSCPRQLSCLSLS
jgi:hypothetical protein